MTRKDGHHPIIFMQCGPVRYRVEPKNQELARPFTHTVIVRPTSFQSRGKDIPDVRSQFQELYGELMADEIRNRIICEDVIEAVWEGRSPVVLTERTEHLEHLAKRLSPHVCHLIVFRGGMGRKALADVSTRLASVPENEDRVLLIGYKVQLPASAIPGWPADVPLPVDPLWKQDYTLPACLRLSEDVQDCHRSVAQ